MGARADSLLRLWASGCRLAFSFGLQATGLSLPRSLKPEPEARVIRSPPALFDHRLHHRVLKVAIELRVGRTLNQQQAGHLFLAIHPVVRAEGAVPAERSVRGPAVRGNLVDDDFH